VNILIIGATGFIGRELTVELERAGHKVVAVSRNARKAREILGSRVEIVEWDGLSSASLGNHLTGIEAVVNLAGESIASGRWTSRRKKLITESRVNTGRLLTEAVMTSNTSPSVLIQGSAIGIYGTHVDVPGDESQPEGTGFMAELVKAWESSVAPAGNKIARMVFIRNGLVLGNGGGLMEKMLLPFRFFCGTVLGSGRQWMSWIHIHDVVRAIRFLIENTNCSGTYNLTAPNPVRMKDFIASMAEILRKPVLLKLPGFVLKASLGKMAEETVLSSQNIYPGKLLRQGFIFEYPHLPEALKNLLTEKKS
jgi:hypothetical protein